MNARGNQPHGSSRECSSALHPEGLSAASSLWNAPSGHCPAGPPFLQALAQRSPLGHFQSQPASFSPAWSRSPDHCPPLLSVLLFPSPWLLSFFLSFHSTCHFITNQTNESLILSAFYCSLSVSLHTQLINSTWTAVFAVSFVNTSQMSQTGVGMLQVLSAYLWKEGTK